MEKSFKIESGVIVASDPCYTIEPPTWCQGIIENVKKGTWYASVNRTDEGNWGMRNASLIISHEDAKGGENHEEMPFSAGVDSGQFGFFDKTFYRNDKMVKDAKKYDFGNGEQYDMESGDSWYRVCCDITLNNKENWGVLEQGVVSSSGFGDGSYVVYGAKDKNGEYISFIVVFIGDELEAE